jgi:hypothetical protein
MALLRSQPVRWATAIALMVLAATAIVGWAGGSDPFEGARPAVAGAVVIAWLLPDLQTEPAGWTRRLEWFAVIAGAVVIVASLAELAV